MAITTSTTPLSELWAKKAIKQAYKPIDIHGSLVEKYWQGNWAHIAYPDQNHSKSLKCKNLTRPQTQPRTKPLTQSQTQPATKPVTQPQTQPKESIMTTNNNAYTNNFGIVFSAPKTVTTKKGKDKIVASGTPTQEFWAAWKEEKDVLRKQGYNIRQVWQVEVWGEATAEAKAVAQPAVKAPVSQPAPVSEVVSGQALANLIASLTA